MEVWECIARTAWKKAGEATWYNFHRGMYLESEKCGTVRVGTILMAMKGLKGENIMWLGCTSRTQVGWDPVWSGTKKDAGMWKWKPITSSKGLDKSQKLSLLQLLTCTAVVPA